jgi:hypothetical protein
MNVSPTTFQATSGAFVALTLSLVSTFVSTSRARASPLVAVKLPAPLATFVRPAQSGEGIWHPAGSLVHGRRAIYTTTLRLPDNPTVSAGIAWMDTNLLSARLYSGSLNPGGLFWMYTAPISPAASRTLVAAFAGAFLPKVSKGGYLSEGHLAAPLRVGAASLVIYCNGSVTVGQWGRDVATTKSDVAVRQNLTLLVDGARPVAGLIPSDVSRWGARLHAVPTTPRSGLGVTGTGALVYVSGPMTITDLATLLVRAGAVRAMVLDMNPEWTAFATYTPATPNAPATPQNGRDLIPPWCRRRLGSSSPLALETSSRCLRGDANVIGRRRTLASLDSFADS